MTVAQRIGIAESTLHRYERGAVRPSRTIETAWNSALYKEAP
jgi:DNA-binding XRE family transcriptional regulator